MQKNCKSKKKKWICISGIIASGFFVATTILVNYQLSVKNYSSDISNNNSVVKMNENFDFDKNIKANQKQESLSAVIPNQTTTRSRNFKEIAFNKDGNKFFSLVYENNNLFFKTLVDDTLLSTAALNSNMANENNINTLDGVAFGTNILSIEKISVSNNGENSNITKSINTNFDTSVDAPTFVQSGRNSYFKAGTNLDIDLGLTNNDAFMVRFYLNGSDANSLSISYDDGNGTIIDRNSSTNIKESINMLSNNNSIAIEGWISKNINGLTFSFTKPDAGETNNVILGTPNISIFDTLKNRRAEQALDEISNGNPSAPSGMTWAQYFRGAILNSFNEAQIKLSSFRATANSATGIINVQIYNPISTRTATPTSNLQHYIYIRNTPPPRNFGEISGFNTGTILLKNDFTTTITAIPEFAIDHNDHLLSIYKTLAEDGFGPDNLLDIFDYRVNMRLDNVITNNLNGTLEAELIILNNYRNPDGSSVTNNISKNFGKIFMSNFSTIQATETRTNNIVLPNDSPLVSIIPSEAVKDEASLLNLIFNNHAFILNNLPNNTNTPRNVLISDFQISDILANNARGTIALKVELNYYFNQSLGIYQNLVPFVFDLNIAGFAQTKETVIDTSKNYVLEGTNNIYPQNYIINPNVNLIIQNYIYDNTNEKLLIIDNAPLKGTANGFNVNDIFIKEVNALNLNGEVEVIFTILKWFDQSGTLNNSAFPEDKKLIFSNFKKAEPTFINSHNANRPFVFANHTLSPTEFLTLNDSEAKIKQFIIDNAFNISTQNIIIGSLPTDHFDQSNIHIIDSRPVDLQGQIEIQFSINSYILPNGNIVANGNFDLNSPIIRISGFKVVEETRLLNNIFITPEEERNNPAVTFSIEKAKRFLNAQLADNKLLNSYPSSIFDPSNDLDIRDYSFDNIIGEVYFNLYVKNYYDASGIVNSTFKLMGRITIYGFSQLKVTSIENNKSFSIANTMYQEKYVDQIDVNDMKNIIKMFVTRNQVIINIPNNFDFINNINNVVLAPNKFDSTINVTFSINYYYNDQGIAVSNPELQGNIIITGFLIPPITRLNDNIYDFNAVTDFHIKSVYNEPLNAVQIGEYINVYGFEAILLNGQIIGKPIIKIDNPRNTSQKLNIIFNQNSLKINANGSLSFTCTFNGGYYFYDSIPIEIENSTQIRTFTIYNLGILTDSSVSAPVTIGIIVASSIIGLIVMFVLAYLIRKRMIVQSSYGDKYDDEDPKDKLSF